MVGNLEVNKYIRKIVRKYVTDPIEDEDIKILHQTDNPSGWQAIAYVPRIFPTVYYDIIYDAPSKCTYLSVLRRVKTERYVGEI